MPKQIETEVASVRIQLVATPRWLRRVDAWRSAQPTEPSRSRAIRQLAEKALDQILIDKAPKDREGG